MRKIILNMSFFLLIAFSGFAQNSIPQQTTATAGTLTVTFSTNNTGNSAYTEYMAAIYITDSSNKLINTLLYRTSNADQSAHYLTFWWALIGSSWSTVTAKSLTTADAITTATAKNSFYTNQNLYWGKLASVSNVSDGNYSVHFEICNCTSGGSGLPLNRYVGSFVKGSESSTVTVTATKGYSNISISWQPTNTALENVEQEKMYLVYPNPALSDIYVSGIDIKGVDICSLSGKVLLNSKVQNVNVSSLPKGAYLAVIYTKSGTVVKKIEKL